MMKAGLAGMGVILFCVVGAYWLSPRVESVAAGLTLATALVVLWYTLETQAMRKQMVAQGDAAIRPLLVVRVEDVGTSLMLGREMTVTGLVLRNIGHGPALRAAVSPIEIVSRKGDGSTTQAHFSPIDLVEPGSAEQLRYRVGEDAPYLPQLFGAHGTPDRDYEFRIEYRDIIDREFESVFTLGKSGGVLRRYKTKRHA